MQQIENIVIIRAGEPLERYMRNLDILPGPWGSSVEQALVAYESRTGARPRVFCHRGPLLWVVAEAERVALRNGATVHGPENFTQE